MNALAALEQRAGASDTDREAWLAERLTGVTATGVRDLVIGANSQQDLIDLKLGRRTDSFAGNRYTAWGNEREPVIADRLRGEGFEPESRVYRHRENDRHLASPDGVRADFDGSIEVAEIKTAAHDLAPGSDEIARKGYEWQCQWVMWVTDAVRCRFVVEERIEMPDGSFTPGTVHTHWIERDEDTIASLVTLADAFLAELDRQRVEGAPAVDEALDTAAVNYLRGLDLEREAKTLKEASWTDLMSTLTKRGVPFQQTSALARITFKPGEDTEVEEPDVQAAKDADPALFAEVQALSKRWNEHQAQYRRAVVKPGRVSLRVTPVKAKEARS